MTGEGKGDARFGAVNSDPRFRRPKKKLSKVKIDGRFKDMFVGEDFVHPVKRDKYGRKIGRAGVEEEKEQMERFYELEEAEDCASNTSDRAMSDDEAETSDAESDASDAASISTATKEEDFLMDQVMSAHPLVNTKVEYGDASKRLAVVNLDWDQIKAVDIYSFANAFKPTTGVIISVTIYTSEFGRERLALEAVSGPPTMIYREGSTGDAGGCASEFDERQLRKYQLERLRYYYAVIECDSVETSVFIYKTCDGAEFEQSGNIVDMRFIPDSVVFSEEDKYDFVDSQSRARQYLPKTDIATAALQNSTVKLTWDQDDPERRVMITKSACGLSKNRRKKIDVRDIDLAAYLASASSDDSDDGRRTNIEDYRCKLLQPSGSGGVFERESREKGNGLEVTFASPFDAGCGQYGDKEGVDDVDAEATFDMEASESETDAELTVFERQQLKLRQKKAERKAKRRAELGQQAAAPASAAELAALLRGSDAAKHFDQDDMVNDEMLGKRRHKRRTGSNRGADSRASHVDPQDPRFAAIYDQPDYAIDPSQPSFKRTPGMQALLEERSRRRIAGSTK